MIRSILLIFRIKKFHGDQFWLNYVCCVRVCVHYSPISLHAIELNRVCKFQQMQLQQQWISFYRRFSNIFFPYFSLWYMSLVSVTAWMKKKIDHKFSFCTIFFPRFIQKKVNDFLNFTVWWLEEPSSMCTEKSWSCVPAQPKGMETY